MSSSPVALILGSGPRVGTAVAESLAASGYNIALAARKGTDAKTAEGYLSIKADFADPDCVPAVFDAVKQKLGAAPSVVIYNAASLTPPPDENSVLSIPAARVTNDLNINTVTPFVAAEHTVQGWATLPSGASKVFIYTGNAQSQMVVPVPMVLSLGVGKAGSAYWLAHADASYGSTGYRFIYADERHEDGKLKGMEIDGPAHGEFYSQLVKSTAGIPSHATFVKGKGYVSFK